MHRIIISLTAGGVMVFLLYLILKIKSRFKEVVMPLADEEAIFIRNSKAYNLSNREMEVARLILRGWTYKGVADHLFIAEKTVDSHIQHIYSKTGARNKLSLYNLLYRDNP